MSKKANNKATHPLQELDIILGAARHELDEGHSAEAGESVDEAQELVTQLKREAGIDSIGDTTGERWFIVHGRMYDKDDECGVYHCATHKEAQRKFREEQGHDFEQYPEGCEHEGPGYAFITNCFDCGTTKPEVV